MCQVQKQFKLYIIFHTACKSYPSPVLPALSVTSLAHNGEYNIQMYEFILSVSVLLSIMDVNGML